MKQTFQYSSLSVTAQLSTFNNNIGPQEHHVVFTLNDPMLSASVQISNIRKAFDDVISYKLSSPSKALFKRWFLSDAANQAHLIPMNEDIATSVIEQAPLNGTKIALWAWLIEDSNDLWCKGIGVINHNCYTHHFSASQTVTGVDSETATKQMFDNLSRYLQNNGASLADNCVRTWLFVRDIDLNYQGVVIGRNKAFEAAGLKAHFIASTGIEGRTAVSKALVAMDSYCIEGLKPGQLKYLYAKEYLNPTHEYGVAFERGAYINYGDRRHVFISGTASINNRGEIVYTGNLIKQNERMLTNVKALLDEADCNWEDVSQMIIYLRDWADYSYIEGFYNRHFSEIPRIIVHAPVCRPGWLIEMECIATKGLNNPEYPYF